MHEILELITGMSPYLLLGFLLAGLMHVFVPAHLYKRFLGGHSFRSVFYAALVGIPLPLCSCGAIPTAMSLRREGASKGATISFLIVTPQSGIDSIIATYSLLGLPFAFLRPIAALVTSVAGGFLVNAFDKERETAETTLPLAANSSQVAHRSLLDKFKNALHYAFIDMMQDIGKWLVVGLIVAGLITVCVPDSFFALFADKPLLSMLFVLLFSIPMYLCATGSIPIAVALMLKGLSPGTALVLLMAGPAINFASMLIISKVMGRRALLLYLLSIVGGAIGFGLFIDHLLPREWFAAPLQQVQHSHECGVSIFNWVATALLLFLLLFAFYKRRHHHAHCDCHGECECHDVAEQKKVFVVKGMSCNHCKSNVERIIQKVDGVEKVEVDLTGEQATVYGEFSNEAVIAAVASIGFEAFEQAKE